MVNFLCDNKKIESRLIKLTDILLKNDAVIHENLTVACQNGQFSVLGAQSMEAKKPCISIPERCFVPVDDISFSIRDNHICIDDIPSSFSKDQAQLAEIIFDLYTLTDKYKYYLSASVMELYYHNAALFDFVTVGYDFGLQRPVEKDAKEKTHIDTFLKIRTFLYNNDQLKKQRIIAPIIEYVNHNLHAVPVAIIKGSKSNSRVVFNNPLEGSNEVFINYGECDIRQLFFLEGYNERNVQHVKSIPLEFSLGKYTDVEIFSGIEKLDKKLLNEHIKDLEDYFPTVAKLEDNILGLRFIYIPIGQSHRALRRILAAVFGSMIKDEHILQDAVLYAEHIIIKENIEHYEEGLRRLAAYSPAPELENLMVLLQEMHQLQIKTIKTYFFFDAAISYQSTHF